MTIKHNLLILDDHAIFSESLGLVLGDEFNVALCTDADQLLTKTSFSNVDILLLDYTLADQDGLKVYAEIKTRENCPPVLLITASNESSVIRQARQAGIEGYFHKSEPLDKLKDAIRELLAGNRWWPTGGDRDSLSAISKKHGITTRQLDVLHLISQGYTNSDISKRLYVTESTVKSHITALFTQLAVKNRTSCLRTARMLGLL